MKYYHCSPVHGLKVLKPGIPTNFDKPARVYLTTLLPMALMYGVRNFEYTYGYTKNGQIYYEEYFPNALKILYEGKSASLYICTPDSAETTRIPNEAVAASEVAVQEEIIISDVYEALLEQERQGMLVIRRYEQLSPRMLAWIRKAEKEEILKRDLLNRGGPMAEYMKIHYPDSWQDAEKETQALW